MQRGGCDYKDDLRKDLNDFGFRINLGLTDFITVHTFGGRGSPF